ncbi:MAG: MlaD family protein [Kiritimatiellia bacterium]
MSQKANPAVIGIFVLVGAALALGATLILTSGSWMKTTHPYVMVFEGDVSGLLPGAPVQYQGVTIGSVESVPLVVNREKDEAYVTVMTQFDPSRIQYVGEAPPQDELREEVKEGLRAELQSQSLVTGLKKIMLVHKPDTPMVLHNPGLGVPEVPTVPTLGETLAQSLADLPFRDMVIQTHQTLQNLERVTAALAEEATVESARATLNSVRALSSSLETELPRMSSEAVATSKSLRELLASISPLADELSQDLPTLLKGFDSNSKAFLELQANLDQTLQELRRSIEGGSSERYQFRDTMARLADAAEQARLLLDYIERHPESILTGKPQP